MDQINGTLPFKLRMPRVEPKTDFVIGVVVFEPFDDIDEVGQNPLTVWLGTLRPIAPARDRRLRDIRDIGSPFQSG